MWRSKALREIETLDPVSDHERIVYLTTCFEFPFDMTRALEFALFRTYCVPSISGLLARTGEFESRPQKRYDDTDILISELMINGHSSARGKRSIARMNQLHGRFRIPNDDFLYVLSTFVFEPIRWLDRFGYRRLSEAERRAMFEFWRHVGEGMSITGIPESYDAFERFNRAYEAEHFEFSETNARIGAATVNLFAGWFPRPLVGFVRPAIYAMLDDPLIEAFGFPKPSPVLRRLLPVALRLRARAAGLVPSRARPRLRTEMARPSYPDGYEIETVGPND